jgi:uracil-DNA glycosylase family 4
LPPKPNAPAVFAIGQNPGNDEDIHGLPFVGPSGALLRGALFTPSDELTLNPALGEFQPGIYFHPHKLHARCSIYITNTVRCHTGANAKPGYRAHIVPCAPHTLVDLTAVLDTHHECDRNIVLCLGAVAADFVWKLVLGNSRARPMKEHFGHQGELHAIDGRPFTLFFTYHPAAVIRDWNLSHAVEGHMKLLSDFLDGIVPFISKPTIVPVRILGAPR